jgi:hypothetical protein
MPSPTSTSTSYTVLTQRQQYTPCHLRLPDEPTPTAGVIFQEAHYSFFRVLPTLDRAKQLVDRLMERGNRSILTTTPKGYALWVYEAKAQCHSKRDGLRKTSHASGFQDAAAGGSEVQILRSERLYQSCKIQVPDLDKPLTGIVYNQQVHSLLRIVRDEAQATELADKLVHKGNKALITASAYGYSVWVLEPEGRSV